jgi:SAM-dependent methyltransferase
MKSMTFDDLKQIVESVGKLEGWDFSRVRDGRDPLPWNYVDVVKQYLKPTDRVLDIGTGGGEIFLSLAPYFGEGVGIDDDAAMIKTAQRNQSNLSIDNVSLMRMDGKDLQYNPEEFDVVLSRHVWVHTSEVVRVLRPGGYFIMQAVGIRSSQNFREAFGWVWSPDSEYHQSAADVAEQFRSHSCHIIALGEYDVPYWFQDMESFIFWLMWTPWAYPEEIELEKHWQYINRIVETCQTERGIETTEHRELLVAQKP